LASEDELSEIEAEFAASWDCMEQFYSRRMLGNQVFNSPWKHVIDMLNLIAKLRQRGYDRRLRAGQQLDALVLSRSRVHGLRLDQSRFSIEASWNEGAFVGYGEPPDIHLQFQIERAEITPEVEELLQRLLAQPID
jgi:hypothetical protein